MGNKKISEKRMAEIMERAKRDNERYHQHQSIPEMLSDIIFPTYRPPSDREKAEIYKIGWKLQKEKGKNK